MTDRPSLGASVTLGPTADGKRAGSQSELDDRNLPPLWMRNGHRPALSRGSTEHRDLPSEIDESRLRNVSDAVERKPLAETPGIEHRIDTSCDRAREAADTKIPHPWSAHSEVDQKF